MLTSIETSTDSETNRTPVEQQQQQQQEEEQLLLLVLFRATTVAAAALGRLRHLRRRFVLGG
jgi:hypothetical protein